MLAVDYASRWVEEIYLPSKDSKGVVNILEKNILTYCDTPSAIIFDGSSHFWNRLFGVLLSKYEVSIE